MGGIGSGRERRSSFSFGGSSSSISRPKDDQPPVDVYQIGLLNLGNSCFYNTILQSLSVTRPLASIIANPPSTSPALMAISPNSPSYNPDPATLLSPLPISQALVTMLSKLDPVEKKPKPKTFNPKALLRELSKKYEEYAAATQQDSHELLRHLIDGVMMEEVDLIKKILQQPKGHRSSLSKRRLTIRADASPLINSQARVLPELAEYPIVDEPDADDENGEDQDEEEDEDEDEGEEAEQSSGESDSSSSSETSDEEEDEDKLQARELARNRRKTKMRPFIDSVFGGKLASVVICEECKNVSLTREDFMDLSLSLKDDSAKMRKRDRIRKSLQAGFFSKKSNAETSSKSSLGSSAPATPPALVRRETTSLSEAEASASPSGSDFESESNDEGPTERARLRRKSLEPALLRSQRPLWAAATSREGSPIGRALSVMSKNGRPSKSRVKPRIPKPTREQLEYIKKVLADIPGPAPSPLPAQLRWATPPGTKPADTSTAAQSLSQLKLQSNSPSDTSTDLYACLQQFTAVETLDSENSFACRNCWKLLNPDLVQRRQEEKALRRQARAAQAEAERAGRSRTMTVNESSSPEVVTHQNELPQSPSMSSPTPSIPISLRVVPSILASSADDEATPRVTSPLDPTPESAALRSSASLASQDTGTTDSLTDDEVHSQLADVEDSGDMSDDGSAEVPPPSAPLTEENIQSLAPTSSSSLAASSVWAVAEASSGGASVLRAPSGASLSTRFSSSTNMSKRLGPPPPRRERHILRRAHKRYLISSLDLPPVLVIHFKRFMQTSKALFGGSFSNLKKRDDDLSFPQELDLTPFLTPTEKPPRSTPGRERSPKRNPMAAPEVLPSARYRLYAVVVHIGNLGGGHYVNYVLSDRYGDPRKPVTVTEEDGSEKLSAVPLPRRWFYCSDDEVRPVSVDEVLRSKAYMLFYERVDKTAVPPTRSRM